MDREWFMLEDEDINEFLPLCERFYQTFKALEELEEYDKNFIEESKLVVKFECRPITITIPKPKPKTPA